MKTDIVFENLKVGQEVYSLQYGKGVVDKIQEEESYPIICKFINSLGYESIVTHTKDGKQGGYHNSASLFLTNPFENLNQERVIEVKSGRNWIHRVCIKVVDGEAICWYGATTIESAKSQKRVLLYEENEWRELQPEQPAAEQPKEITIDGVEYTLMPKNK